MEETQKKWPKWKTPKIENLKETDYIIYEDHAINSNDNIYDITIRFEKIKEIIDEYYVVTHTNKKINHMNIKYTFDSETQLKKEYSGYRIYNLNDGFHPTNNEILKMEEECLG